MQYSFQCTCGQVMAVTPDHAGRTARCPVCRVQFTVPPPPQQGAYATQIGRTTSMQQRAFEYVANMNRRGPSGQGMLQDFRHMDFKAEVLPLSQHSITLLRSDFVFWSVAMLGVVPLLVGTLSDTQDQLMGMCLFFAAMWGVLFKRFIVEDEGPWWPLVGALFFTGIIGIKTLLFIYSWMPNVIMAATESEHRVVSLLAYIFQVGVFEEMTKIVPVLIYIAIKRRAARPLTIILVGVFSGMGFAAFENRRYFDGAVERAISMTNQFGGAGLVQAVFTAMVTALLRSMSCIFGHSIYSGIFSYFVALGWATQRRILALALVGLSVASLIHGFYDWFFGVQPMFSVFTTVLGFVLFYAYLTKLRLTMASSHEELR